MKGCSEKLNAIFPVNKSLLEAKVVGGTWGK